MKELSSFASSIPDFFELQSSVHIDCFAYYLTRVENQKGFTTPDIIKCFSLLEIPPYSNIYAYLKRNRTKFFQTKGNYFLLPKYASLIEQRYLQMKKVLRPTDDLFPIEIFSQTRGYIEIIAKQAAVCYEYSLFDACSVMCRRLLETLIIELFEKNKLENYIKDNNGNYLFLRDLIAKYKEKFSLSRNTKNDIDKLKELGDLSAHNRKYLARKSDIDHRKDLLRLVLEELIHTIDYPSWKI